MKLWLIAIGKFLARAVPKFLVNRSVLKLTGKRSLMLLSFVVLTAAVIIFLVCDCDVRVCYPVHLLNFPTEHHTQQKNSY